MQGLQDILDRSVETGDLPFVVAAVANGRGLEFLGASGDAASGQRATRDTLFRLFSMTKPIGAAAAMTLIDRGRLDPDCPVEDIVPEFASLRVLAGWNGDEPVMRPPARKATVRNLLTHTSGLEYELWSEQVAEYLTRTGHPSVLEGTMRSLGYPMTSDPGERWAYGPSYDWLGVVVETVAGRGIVEYVQAEILDPLRMEDTHFDLDSPQPERLAEAMARTEAGSFEPTTLAPAERPEVYSMGHALYGTAPDYVRFLRMLLNGGELEGARLLTPGAVDEMLSSQMPDRKFTRMVSCSPLSADFDPAPGANLTSSFGFLRNETDRAGLRSSGSQGWAGLLNSHFWLDRRRDVAGVFMTQSLPFAEPRMLRRYEEFERRVYRDLG